MVQFWTKPYNHISHFGKFTDPYWATIAATPHFTDAIVWQMPLKDFEGWRKERFTSNNHEQTAKDWAERVIAEAER